MKEMPAGRKRILRNIAWTYGILWAITALFGLPDVDRKFDVQFAVGTAGLGMPGKRQEVLPVMRIPFSRDLRDPKTFPPHVPDKPWRARSDGFAVAPFVIIDEIATVYAALGGGSERRLVLWFFGYSVWMPIRTFWMA